MSVGAEIIQGGQVVKTDFKDLEDRYLHNISVPNCELDTRSKLLEAAVKVFSKYGYDGASLRQISDLAGVKHGLIKYHHKNKNTLWQAVVTFLYDMMLNALEWDDQVGDKILNADGFRNHMISMTRAYIRFSAKYPELFRILMFEILLESERLDWVVENFSKPLIKKSMIRIHQGKAAGIFPKNVSDMNVFYIMMTANRTIFLLAPEVKRTFGVDVFSEQELQQHEDAIIEMIYRYLRP